MLQPDFFEHLEEFRRRLIICLIVFGLASAVSWFFTHAIIDFLILPLKARSEAELYFNEPHQAFFMHMQAACLAGFLISAPVLLTQAWLFIAPGLYQREKNALIPLISISTVLFFAGAAFAYFFVIPWGLGFLLSFQTENLKPLVGVAAYFSFVMGMTLAFGILFDFPVVIVGLAKFGLVRAQTFAKARRVIILIIFVLAAILTPSPDPISQLMLAIPLWILFEASLLVARMIEKR